MTSERRRETRVPYDAEVTEYGDKERKWKGGNLSEGGIFLPTLTPLPAGTVIEIGFYLPGYEVEVLAEAMVEWTNVPDSPTYDPKRENGMGLMFLDIDPAQDKVLQAFINKQRWHQPTDTDELEALIDDGVKHVDKPAVPTERANQKAAPVRAAKAAATPATKGEAVESLLADLNADGAGITFPAQKTKKAAVGANATAAKRSHDAVTAAVRTQPATKAHKDAGAARPKPGQKAAAQAVTAPDAAASTRDTRPKASDKIPAHSAAVAEALAKAGTRKAGKKHGDRPKPGAHPSEAARKAESEKVTKPVGIVSPAAIEAKAPVSKSAAAVSKSTRAVAKATAAKSAPEKSPALASYAEEIALGLEESVAAAAPTSPVLEVELEAEPIPAIELEPEPIPAPATATPDAAPADFDLGEWVGLDDVADAPPDTAAQQLSETHEPTDSVPAAPGVDPYLAERLPIGSVLGSYRIQSLLGSGGMGDVYLAEHINLGRKVALKRLRSALVDNQQALKRFFDEARAVNQIHHENIVEVTDFVAEPEHTYYIMEYLDGPTLAELQTRGRGLPTRQALHVAIQVCGALDAVHSAGIIHRDLKPQNIMLIQRGGDRDFVKLLDFGVAKLKDSEAAQALSGGADGGGGGGSQTTGSMLLGTPGYMAPEQLLGQAIDHRVDIYALGVILYQMTTGTNPFVADTWGEAVVKHVTELPPPLTNYDSVAASDLPADLETLILQCLAKKPEERPATAGEVGTRLREITKVFEAGGAFRVVGAKKKRRVGRWIAAATTFSLLAAAGILVGVKGPKESLRLAEATVSRIRGSSATAADKDDEKEPANNSVKTAAAKPAPAAPEPEPEPAVEVAAAPTESSADALYNEGKSLLKANKALLAVEVFNKAIAANPKHIKTYRMLGRAYVLLGREQKAIESFEKFVKLAPNHKDAAKTRQIIAAYRGR